MYNEVTRSIGSPWQKEKKKKKEKKERKHQLRLSVMEIFPIN